MSKIATADMKFLRKLVDSMEDRVMNTYQPGANRAGQAIILRFREGAGTRVAKSFTRYDWGQRPQFYLDRLSNDTDDDAASTLSMLIIKRQEILDDSFSGQIGFPGGKKGREDEDGRTATEREVFDELGVPLEAGEFIYLGQLSDYTMMQGTANRSNHLVLSRYVYLHIGELTPIVNLAKHSVHGTQWVNVDIAKRQNLRYTHVKYKLWRLLRGDTVWRHARRVELVNESGLGAADIAFPSVPLPLGWSLWGAPLVAVSEMNEWGGRERLDWPRFKSENPVVQNCIIHPWHAWQEMFGEEDHGPKNPTHFFWLLFDIAAFVGLWATLYLLFRDVLFLIVDGFKASLNYNGAKERQTGHLIGVRQLDEFQRDPGTWRATEAQVYSPRGPARVVGDLKKREISPALGTVEEEIHRAEAANNEKYDLLSLQELRDHDITKANLEAMLSSDRLNGGTPQEKVLAEVSAPRFIDVGDGKLLPTTPTTDDSLSAAWVDPKAYEQELLHGGTMVSDSSVAAVALKENV